MVKNKTADVPNDHDQPLTKDWCLANPFRDRKGQLSTHLGNVRVDWQPLADGTGIVWVSGTDVRHIQTRGQMRMLWHVLTGNPADF
jgi:hypothetical protein